MSVGTEGVPDWHSGTRKTNNRWIHGGDHEKPGETPIEKVGFKPYCGAQKLFFFWIPMEFLLVASKAQLEVDPTESRQKVQAESATTWI